MAGVTVQVAGAVVRLIYSRGGGIAAVECIQLLAKSNGARTRQHSRLVHRYCEDITERLVKVDSGPAGYTRVEIIPAALGDAVWIFEHRRL